MRTSDNEKSSHWTSFRSKLTCVNLEMRLQSENKIIFSLFVCLGLFFWGEGRECSRVTNIMSRDENLTRT